MSNAFIRGSQTTLHFLRMLRQSLKMMLKLFVILFIVFFVMFIMKYAHPYPFTFSLHKNYVVSKMGSALKVSNPISFKDENGYEVKLTHPEYLAFYNQSIYPYVMNVSKDAASYSVGQSFLLTFMFFLFTLCKGTVLGRTQFVRGIKLVKPYRLKLMVFFYNLKKSSFKNFQLAEIPYPNHSEYQHTVITGGSGSGKTQAMLNLIDQIRERGEKIIIYDRMGSFIRKFYDSDKDVILNPLDGRGKNWNLFDEIKHDADFNMIASSLIPDSKGADPFWTKAARTVFTKVCIKLRSEGKNNVSNVIDTLLKLKTKDLIEYLADTSAAAIIDTDAEKTAASIRAVLGTYIEALELLKSDRKTSFSIRNWVNNNDQDSVLFLTSRADQHEVLKPLISLFIELAVNEILIRDQQQSKRIWFFLDELPSLQKLTTLETALAQIRQFGGAFVLSTQLMSQLKEIYGYDTAETISGLCRNRLFFSTPDEKTASWCASNLGKNEKMGYKEGISFGAHQMRDGVNIHKQKELETLVLPSEIMNLKSLSAYLKFSEGMPVSKVTVSYKGREDVAEKFVEKQVGNKATTEIPASSGDEKVESSSDTDKKPNRKFKVEIE